jgi:hypothetical protein
MGRKLLKSLAVPCAAFFALAGQARKKLRPPDPKFGGVIKDNASQSKASPAATTTIDGKQLRGGWWNSTLSTMASAPARWPSIA